MTKTEIVEAAFRVWGRNFYLKTSLSQLAGELKVSKPALYRHFKNKQALTAAMTESFLDNFAASIRADFEKAQKAADIDEGIFTIIQSISGYFARNVYFLIFSLTNIYDRNLNGRAISERLKTRGVDLGMLKKLIEKKYAVDTSVDTSVNTVVIQLIFASLTFLMSHFHKTRNTFENLPADEDIEKTITDIKKIIESGLGLTAEKVNSLDFEKLEKQVDGTMLNTEPEPLFKAVAEAVAQAGPWNASMDMVAKRLGLSSKSSLYGHFKNRKDMLRRLFITEFKRIIEFARQGINMSSEASQQLYLGIFSIAIYLGSRPEILTAMDWIRTRKLDLGRPDKQIGIFRLFEDLDIERFKNADEDDKQRLSRWILFLLINTLMRPIQIKKGQQAGFNNDIRVLYKFITLGLGGFKR